MEFIGNWASSRLLSGRLTAFNCWLSEAHIWRNRVTNFDEAVKAPGKQAVSQPVFSQLSPARSCQDDSWSLNWCAEKKEKSFNKTSVTTLSAAAVLQTSSNRGKRSSDLSNLQNCSGDCETNTVS
ncbi:hypothetical protein K0M31_019748, partial [Melipona bicolor]